MTTPSAPCRVTVVAPSSRIDVALPRECTLAEVIPQLVRLAGAPPQPGDHSTGWGLSRLGEPALAPGLTVSAAALRDGEVLHLRPRERHEPPLLFDDVVDAIASAAENRRGSWRPAVGRRLALTAAALLFLASALLVLAGLSGRPAVAWGVGVVSLLLLLAGGGLVRGLGDPQAGVACAAAGLLAAPLAGATAPPPYVAWPPEAGSLALALGATTVYAALAATVVAHATAWFVAVATAAGCGALATATVLLFDVRPAHAAAVTAPLVVALAAAAPDGGPAAGRTTPPPGAQRHGVLPRR
nr:hypothetical protein GCM10020241_07380 [Streptoalloteichus tenebrarius]